jgi:hypothetical protein
MFLESYLTTIPRPDSYPEKVADLGFRAGTQVTIPYLDSRTCSGISLDMHEDNEVSKLFEYDGDGNWVRDKTLALALKVYYRGRIVFHGPLSAPRYDFTSGKIELVAHDPSLRLKRAYLVSGDPALSAGISLDGEGLMLLLDSAQNTAPQDALNWPSLGIIRGVDLTTGSLQTTTLTRGDNIWQAMTDLGQALTGPDFDLEPIETDPAELASGTDFANYFGGGAAIADNATTDFSLAISFPGTIGGLRVGIWADHTAPRQVNIDLVHPDGTSVRVYTGSNEDDPGTGSGDFLGQGSGSDLALLGAGRSLYDQPYPHVGHFRSQAPLGSLYGKPAAGTWKLRVHDTAAGSTGSVKQFRLDFQLPAPSYCRLNATDKPDTSLLTNTIDPDGISGPSCVFHKGHGEDNARILSVTPQGDQVRNQYIAIAQTRTKIRVDDESRAAYGTYQGFDSPGEGHSNAYLAAWADSNVGAYARPVPALELAPVNDGGENLTLRYGDDFVVGRHVRAVGKRGRAYFDVLGRVERVVLTQGPSAVVTDMDVQPAVGGTIADG